MKRKVALISGVTGQDGSYLSEFLLEKGYEVHGIKRRSSSYNTSRIDHIISNKNFHLHYGDVTDSACIIRLVSEIKPTEIYNLAAQSHVAVSFEQPEYTANADAIGALRFLEAIRILGMEKKVRFYQASTSEMFGNSQDLFQTLQTPFKPCSPYACAKLYAHHMTINYRKAYGIFACCGILFNHESPRRGETFVTRKITMAVANISKGFQKALWLGNLNSRRDWGHAKDYVRAMWLMLQQRTPQEYIIATGKQYSVRDFVILAFKEVGINIKFQGIGVDEIGFDESTGIACVRVDSEYYRPIDVNNLLGVADNAKKFLGWKPEISFEEMVKEMVQNDIQIAWSRK